MNELKKLERKRQIYNSGNYMLSDDSINHDVLNVDFESLNFWGLSVGMIKRDRDTYTLNDYFRNFDNRVSMMG